MHFPSLEDTSLIDLPLVLVSPTYHRSSSSVRAGRDNQNMDTSLEQHIYGQ